MMASITRQVLWCRDVWESWQVGGIALESRTRAGRSFVSLGSYRTRLGPYSTGRLRLVWGMSRRVGRTVVHGPRAPRGYLGRQIPSSRAHARGLR